MVLKKLGATVEEMHELLRYNENVFHMPKTLKSLSFPLSDEPFVAAWENYALEAQANGVYATLHKNLAQLQFPIREGIRATESYKAVINAGRALTNEEEGLYLEKPELLELVIHSSSAGKIPLLITRHRNDFVSLVRALTMKNEPKPFTAWLFAIAHNAVSDYFRNLNKNPWSSLETYAEIAGTSQDLGEVVAENELRSVLLKAVAELSERERNIIALKFWSGLTNRSIAKLTGLSESNVGVIIYRAMRRLQTILESGGEEFDERKTVGRTV